MTAKYINARQKQRIDTAANWLQNNPVLLKGELAIESDTGYTKAGDGNSHYNDLEYLRSPNNDGSKIIASIYQPDSQIWIDLNMEDVTVGSESDAWIEIY